MSLNLFQKNCWSEFIYSDFIYLFSSNEIKVIRNWRNFVATSLGIFWKYTKWVVQITRSVSFCTNFLLIFALNDTLTDILCAVFKDFCQGLYIEKHYLSKYTPPPKKTHILLKQLYCILYIINNVTFYDKWIEESFEHGFTEFIAWNALYLIIFCMKIVFCMKAQELLFKAFWGFFFYIFCYFSYPSTSHKQLWG